jgi:hypothetical protein
MANPLFEPVIGSSFDALAGQRANWAGFNTNIEAQNLQRRAQAEQAQNQWLAQVAQIQRQQAQEQDQAAQYASSLAAAQAQRQQEAAAGESQFSRSLAEQVRRTDAENTRTAVTERIAQLAQDAQSRKADVALQNKGAGYASSYAASSRSVAEAQKAYEDLQAQKDANEARLAELTDKAKGKKTGWFGIGATEGVTPDESAEQMALSNSKTQKALERAIEKAKAHAASVSEQHKRLMEQHSGFTVDDINGVITHDESKLSWPFRPKVLQQQPTIPSAMAQGDVISPFGRTLTSGTGSTAPSPWPGMTQSADTGAQPAPDSGAAAEAQIFQNRWGRAPTAAEVPGAASPSPYAEGSLVRSKKDGRLYRITNGQPVLAD